MPKGITTTTIIIIIACLVIAGLGGFFGWKAYQDKSAKEAEEIAKKAEEEMLPEEEIVEAVDTDGDGLTDEEEAKYGTDPNKADTDGDGYNDKLEIDTGYDPLVPGKKLVEEEAKEEEEIGVAEWKTYTNDIFEFSLKYPTDWEVEDNLPEATVMILGEAFKESTVKEPLIIGNKLVKEEPTLILWMDPAGFEPFFPDITYMLEEENDGIKISKRTEELVTEFNTDGIRFITCNLDLKLRDHYYVFHFGFKEDGKDYEPIFKQMLSSFKSTIKPGTLDRKREQDMAQLTVALAMFYDDHNSKYPYLGSSPAATNYKELKTALKKYMDAPNDPQGTDNDPKYTYSPTSDGSDFTLKAALEGGGTFECTKGGECFRKP